MLGGDRRSEVTSAADLPHTGEHYLEHYIYECFLALNLAAPGSAYFTPIVIEGPNGFSTDVRLGADVFEVAWMGSIRSGWPHIRALPLATVVSWLRALDLGTRQIAETPVDRALFGLLHVSQHSSDDAATLIRLAHIMEALFATPRDGIADALRRRVSAVLSVPAERQREIRRRITRFYETRSAFVHGTFAVAHPHGNEVLDRGVDKFREEMMDACDFAASTAIAMLQHLIHSGWRGLTFTEQFQGESVAPAI